MPQLRQYPFLSAQRDVDWQHVDPQILTRLNALGRRRHEVITLTSGARTVAEQAYLYNNAGKLGLVRGKTVAAPGESEHNPGADGVAHAVDATVGGVPLGKAVPAKDLAAAGLGTLKGDDVHTHLSGAAAATVAEPAPAAAPATQDQPGLPAVTAPSTVPTTTTGLPAPAASLPLAGGTDFTLEPSGAQASWQMLAALPDLSPDTQRFIQLSGGTSGS